MIYRGVGDGMEGRLRMSLEMRVLNIGQFDLPSIWLYRLPNLAVRTRFQTSIVL
jgi:hypothetical protein